MNTKCRSILMDEQYHTYFKTLATYEQKWIAKVETFIIDHINNTNLKVFDIATHFIMSERQFYRRIKKTLNITPNAFIRAIKMKHAKVYLEQGEFATIAEVSFAVGYNRSDYFSTIYANCYGKRPAEYMV